MTRLALLWHMHQPYYEDLATSEHILPWVRLHALKDYWGMVALLEEFPGVTVTFNLVPSLLLQIQAFAEDRATDRHLTLGLKPAAHLERDEQRLLVANGFHVPYDRMIRPYPRYAELHARRHHADGFTRQDVIDLQVWHKLVWMDPDWLKTDPRLQRLLALGRNFDEPDKRILREVELELLNAVIPAYTRAAARGQIEVSTSPFYHPILPLLCDSDVHFRAQPHSALPRGLIRRPAAARLQIERALAFHREQFGALPSGMWPSEGSLSDEVVAMLAEHGVSWTATDEEILARSLQQAASAAVLYRPYEVGESGQSIRCLFRDHRLSDLIGFTYQSWDAQRAADDFLLQVRDGGRRFRADAPAGETPVVSVILDGENAWEHYPGGGRPFLRALYGALATATDIETVPMRVAAAGPARRLRQLFPGSWINGDFYIWAGHTDDHRAWNQVADAYASLDAETDESGRARATDELMIAEGSDWFWWYGDDHSSDQDAEFDDLFRRHVRNSYTTRGAEPPVALYTSNITTGGAKVTPVSFRALSTPTMSGEAGDVGDWRSAVSVPLRRGGGTMAQVSGQLIRGLWLAADRSTLFGRLQSSDLPQQVRAGTVALELLLDHPRRLRIPIAHPVASDGFVHLAIPFADLGSQAGDTVRFWILVTDPTGHVVEQQPAWPIALEQPRRHLAAINWSV